MIIKKSTTYIDKLLIKCIYRINTTLFLCKFTQRKIFPICALWNEFLFFALSLFDVADEPTKIKCLCLGKSMEDILQNINA